MNPDGGPATRYVSPGELESSCACPACIAQRLRAARAHPEASSPLEACHAHLDAGGVAWLWDRRTHVACPRCAPPEPGRALVRAAAGFGGETVAPPESLMDDPRSPRYVGPEYKYEGGV